MNDRDNLQENAEREYAHAVDHIRHYSSHRFTSLTIYLAITAALFGVAFGLLEGNHAEAAQNAAKLAGLFVTIVFLCFELITTFHLKHFVTRAVILERQLAYELWSKRPRALVVAIRITVITFYVGILLFWIGTLPVA